jgi:RNA polymerase sigma factor for flagellar operon FliA
MFATAQARNDVITEYWPLARSIALRIHRRLPRQVDADDLIGAAVIGLVDAVDRYDGKRSVPFKLYAQHRIHGAVIDALRSDDFVPRSVRRRSDDLDRTRTQLKASLGRDPSRDEMAATMEVSAERFDHLTSTSQIPTLTSFDAPATDEAGALSERITDDHDPESTIGDDDMKRRIVGLLDTLPEREKAAISLYYLHELSLKEVGAVLGVGESRACQLCSQGMKRMRKALGRDI